MPSFLSIGLQDKLHCRQSSLRKTKKVIESENLFGQKFFGGIFSPIFLLQANLRDTVHKKNLLDAIKFLCENSF